MKDCLRCKAGEETKREAEQGFMLVGLIVAIFFILLALSVAAPKVAQELRREREVETIHRGDQYVRAIRVFYRKNGHYPGTMEQLEKTNNVRYLRQQYLDPITGKADWRLIHVGEAKTTVKGFFGQPLAGLAPGLGANAGSASPGIGGAGAAGSGQTGSGSGSSSGFGSSSGTSGFGSSSGLGSSSGTSGFGSSGASSFGSSGSSGTPTLGGSSSTGGTTLGSDSSGSGSTSTSGSSSGIANQSASSFTGSGAPFVGVGVPKEGDSITILNEQTTYNTWEFLYDPRIEQLYAKGALLGGGSTGLGANAGSASGFGSTPGASSPTTSGFGSSPGSGFGSSPSSGFGSSPGSSSPTPPTTPPQPPQ